ncbi:MAG: type III-B CRISPR module RAMP protein Cmr4 [Nitrosomonas sp.]|nr:MAG: type III-B CRISPR module RAMP protein Cmr4 [Nitrosomonas sp.]
MKQTGYHLHTISALHVGTGQGSGIIDLPIARGKASNLPQIPGSTIKGVLRDELTHDESSGLTPDDLLALFGPETGQTASEYAGALAVGDAHLLCLPIRSWYGTFAWATCPMILHRYRRDLQSSHSIPTPAEDAVLHCRDTQLKDHEKVYLEDLDLNAVHCVEIDSWAGIIASAVFNDAKWHTLFKERFIVLPDNLFDFLAETATEIRSRIRIEEGTRTVQTGALWHEEYLPAETLLWGCVACDRAKKPGYVKDNKQMLALLPATKYLQIGSNASVGAGQVNWSMKVQPQADET